jgi:hypothetical protein
LLENLNQEQIIGILETLPVDISFVDEKDIVKFWNKHETRIFKHPYSALGNTVQQCHPPQSVAKVNKILSDLKSGKRDFAESRVDLEGRKIHVRQFAVRDKGGKYLGTMEVAQDITDITQIGDE